MTTATTRRQRMQQKALTQSRQCDGGVENATDNVNSGRPENLSGVIPEPSTSPRSCMTAPSRVCACCRSLCSTKTRRNRSGSFRRDRRQARVTDDNGNVTVSIARSAAAEALIYREGYEPQEIQLGDDTLNAHRLTLRPVTATLSGVIRDSDHRPVARQGFVWNSDVGERCRWTVPVGGSGSSFAQITIVTDSAEPRSETCYSTRPPPVTSRSTRRSRPLAGRPNGKHATN